MADTRLYIQAQKFSLSIGVSTSETSIILDSFSFPDGTAIAAGDVGSITYGTLEPGTSREEVISFTGFTNNADGSTTLTGVTRGLGFGAVDTYSEQSDLKQQHGAGSVFIISNNPSFYDEFVNKYNDEEISGTLTVPTPTAGGHAATKDYVDGVGGGGSLSYDQIVVAGTAGESLAAGDLIYFDDTDNEWKKTSGSSASSLNGVILGIAQGSGSDGGAISGGVLTSGLDANQTGLTVGVQLFAGDTAGAIAESAGTVEKSIGWSKSATEVYFNPYHNELPSASEKDALAGGGELGTPSSTNKFLTEDARGEQVEFTSSGTWTKDAGLQRIRVQAWGAGGSGGRGDSSNVGGGGGGGGYFEAWFEAGDLGATETVTIGAGGAAATSQAAGSDGGDTTFGSLVTAYGGSGGSQSASPGAGGAGADIQVGSTLFRGASGSGVGIYWGGGGGANGTTGGPGAAGKALFGGGGGGGASSGSTAGDGGTSIYGGAGGAGSNNATATDGTVPAGGGGGSNDGDSGAGADGKVIVTEYYI